MKYLKKFRLFENKEIENIINLIMSNNPESISLGFHLSVNYDADFLTDEIIKRFNIDIPEIDIKKYYDECIKKGEFEKILMNHVWNDYQIYFDITLNKLVREVKEKSMSGVDDLNNINDGMWLMYYNDESNFCETYDDLKKSILNKVDKFNTYINTEFKKEIRKLFDE